MNKQFKNYFAILLLIMLFAPQSVAAAVVTMSNFSSATGGEKTAVAFSFDSVWFYRDGTRVIPEIGSRWLTVVFNPDDNSDGTDFGVTSDSSIEEKAKAVLLSHDRLSEYLYDPNLAEGACFFKMRDGLKLEEIGQLITRLNQDNTVKYANPTLVLANKTFAFFDIFQMEWKTGINETQREALLNAAHVSFDEKEHHYVVDVTSIPFFRALNLLAEDIRVLRATPYLVEIKPSISAGLSLLMSGGNIGNSIPFKLTISFSDRVSIDPSSLATLNLRPSNLQKELFDCTFDPYDYTKAVKKSPVVISGRVQFYAPGEYTLPAVAINYTCPSCPDSNVRSIETEPVLFKVSSIIPAEQSHYRLIVPTDPISLDFDRAALRQQSRRNLWFAIICVAGIIVCAGGLLLLRRKITAEQSRLKERKKDELLAEQLRTLLQAAPTAPHWCYLGEVGTLLREYLVVHYGVDVKYRGGSSSQFMATLREKVPRECLDSLSIIFTAIDTSISLESGHHQDIDTLQREILRVVDHTGQHTAAHG